MEILPHYLSGDLLPLLRGLRVPVRWLTSKRHTSKSLRTLLLLGRRVYVQFLGPGGSGGRPRWVLLLDVPSGNRSFKVNGGRRLLSPLRVSPCHLSRSQDSLPGPGRPHLSEDTGYRRVESNRVPLSLWGPHPNHPLGPGSSRYGRPNSGPRNLSLGHPEPLGNSLYSFDDLRPFLPTRSLQTLPLPLRTSLLTVLKPPETGMSPTSGPGSSPETYPPGSVWVQ